MMAKRFVVPVVLALCAAFAPLASRAADTALPPALKARNTDYCADCHRTLTGAMGNAVSDWKKSTHARRDDNCNICHGGNPDLNDKKLAKAAVHSFISRPDKKTVTDFCGRGGCHRSTIAIFKNSPHYATVQREGSPSCVSCHGPHDIRSPRVGMIQPRTCTACHAVGEVDKTLAALGGIEESILTIEKNAAYLMGKNAESRDISARLADVKILYHQLVHVMSTREIQHTRREIELLLRDLREKSETRVLISRRLDLIYITTITLSFIIIVIFAVFTVRVFSRKQV